MKKTKVHMGPHRNEMCDHLVDLTADCHTCDMIATSAAITLRQVVRPARQYATYAIGHLDTLITLAAALTIFALGLAVLQ